MKLSATPNPAQDTGTNSPVPEELRPFVINLSNSQLSCLHYDFGYIVQQEFPVGNHIFYRFAVLSDQSLTLYLHHDHPFIAILYNTKGVYHCKLKPDLYIETKTGDYGPYYSPAGLNEVSIKQGIFSALQIVLTADPLVQGIAAFSPAIRSLLQRLDEADSRGDAIALLRMNSRVKEQLRLVSLFDETTQHPEVFFQAVLYNLLTELTQQLHTHQQPIPQEKPREKIRKVYEYIVAQPNLRTCTMDHLSGMAGLSEANLRKLFRQIYDQPIQQFVRQQCLHKAAQLLQESASLKIEDIAFEVGYANQSNLSNAFKAMYGVYPQEYRKKVQGR